MATVYLDPNDAGDPPRGFIKISTEMDFLNHALSDEKLYIVGSKLCDWANNFFDGRKIKTREVTPPAILIQKLFPELSLAQTKELANKLGEIFFQNNQVSWKSILQAIYPRNLWEQEPSEVHAANWLSFLLENPIPDYLKAVVINVARIWRDNSDESISWFYEAVDEDSARLRLNHWLGIREVVSHELAGKYPLQISPEIANSQRLEWRQEVIQSRGRVLSDLLDSKMTYLLKSAAADEGYQYFLQKPTELDKSLIDLLSRYIRWEEQRHLRRLLPPPIPIELPDNAEEIFRWFHEQYLPYRTAYFDTTGEHRERILRFAFNFATWYLDIYPKALSGNPIREHMAYRKSLALKKSIATNKIILFIVLDGLNASDGMELVQSIKSKCPRLTITCQDYAFANLPTVTEFCKDSLFRGIPYNLCEEADPIGMVIPEAGNPVAEMKRAQSNNIYVWRVLEPDSTYHKHNSFATLEQDIEAQLDAVVNKIQAIVTNIPDGINLEIYISTDHGRLLGISKKSVEIPPNMQSHGRAAWGRYDEEIFDKGYRIEDNIVILSPEKFGLIEHTAIVLNEDAFRSNDGKGGREKFPHGGLFPEEVIIPWLGFVRDVELPVVKIVLSGKGTARRSGKAILRITNLGDIEVITRRLILTSRGEEMLDKEITLTINPRTEEIYEIDVDQWFSDDQINHSYGNLLLKLQNGFEFDHEVTIELISEDMYHKVDILKDLE